MRLFGIIAIAATLLCSNSLGAQTYTCDYPGQYIIGPACVGTQDSYPYQAAYLPSSHPDNAAYNWIVSISYNWSATSGSVFGSSDPTCYVDWDDVCQYATLSLTAVVVYGHESVENATLTATFECYLEVVVQHIGDLTVAHIGGDHSMIECYNTDFFYLGADAGSCVSGFVWGAYDVNSPWLPNPYWTVEGIASGLTAKITPDQHSPAIIKVYAYDCMGNPGPVSEVLIERGCIDDKSYLYSTTTLPNNLAVNNFIHVHPLTEEHVTVQTGQYVFFKAGDYIDITPGFSTEINAFFQARIGYCDDCYGWRLAGHDADTTESESTEARVALSPKVYPNPCSESTTIILPTADDIYQISLLDVNGNVLMELQSNSVQQLIPTSALSTGLYSILVTDCNGGVWIEQLIKTD